MHRHHVNVTVSSVHTDGTLIAALQLLPNKNNPVYLCTDEEAWRANRWVRLSVEVEYPLRAGNVIMLSDVPLVLRPTQLVKQVGSSREASPAASTQQYDDMPPTVKYMDSQASGSTTARGAAHDDAGGRRSEGVIHSMPQPVLPAVVAAADVSPTFTAPSFSSRQCGASHDTAVEASDALLAVPTSLTASEHSSTAADGNGQQSASVLSDATMTPDSFPCGAGAGAGATAVPTAPGSTLQTGGTAAATTSPLLQKQRTPA
ncbi:MAG: hypothetical protein EOO41_01155, partial [Methanobacteriota archaeon]